MDRIPKYTAGMFKKKMPRFGAASIKKPRLPTPPKPRVKKFAEGGTTENEVIISEEEGRKMYPEMYDRIDRAKKKREAEKKAQELQEQKDLVNRYLQERKKVDEAEAKKKAEENTPEGRERRQRQKEQQFMQDMKRGVRTARSGGTMKSSCCRGDGIVKRGKTRGKFV